MRELMRPYLNCTLLEKFMARLNGEWVVIVAEFCPGLTVVRYEEDRTNSHFIVATAQLS